MRRAQTSVEYLLLTAGVLLVGAIASQAVISSGTATHESIEVEVNNIKVVDTTPPSTDIVCGGVSCYGQYNKSVDIGFFCVDNLGGSGCAITHYEILRNGASLATGDCNQLANECQAVYTLAEPPSGSVYTYTIKFYSVDVNGNVESEKTVKIQIGKSLSKILATCMLAHSPAWPHPGGTLDINGEVTAGIVIDPKIQISSPIDKEYSCGSTLTSGTPCKVTGIPLPSSPNAYILDVNLIGKDGYGNEGYCGSHSIVVDGIAPNVSITSPDPCKWYREDFNVQFLATDTSPSSLLGTMEYRISDGAIPEYTSGVLAITPPTPSKTDKATVTVGPAGFCSEQGKRVCTVEAKYSDQAGNTGSNKEDYSIDYTPPDITVSPQSAGWVRDDITVTISCSDSVSGCHYAHYVLEDKINGTKDEGNLFYTNSSGGCPPEGPKNASTKLTISCPEGKTCAYTLTVYNVDFAGNKSQTKTFNNNPNGDAAYLIDKEKPRVALYMYENNPSSPPKYNYMYYYGGTYHATQRNTYIVDIRYDDHHGSGVDKIYLIYNILGAPNSRWDNISLRCYNGGYDTAEDSAIWSGIFNPTTCNNEGQVLSVRKTNNPLVGYPMYVIDVKNTRYCSAIHCIVTSNEDTAIEWDIAATDVLGNNNLYGESRDGPYVIRDATPPWVPQQYWKIYGTAANPECSWFRTAKIDVNVLETGTAWEARSWKRWDSRHDHTYSGVSTILVYYDNSGIASVDASANGFEKITNKVPGDGTTYDAIKLYRDDTQPAIQSAIATITVTVPDGKYVYFDGSSEQKTIHIKALDVASNDAPNPPSSTEKEIYGFGVDRIKPEIHASLSENEICSWSDNDTPESSGVTVTAQDAQSGIYSIRVYLEDSSGNRINVGKPVTYDCDTTEEVTIVKYINYETVGKTGTFDVYVDVTDNAGNVATKYAGKLKILNACTEEKCTSNEGNYLDDCKSQSGWHDVNTITTATTCNPNSSSCSAPDCGPAAKWDKYEYRDYTGCHLEANGQPFCDYTVEGVRYIFTGTTTVGDCSAEGDKVADQSAACSCNGSVLECSVPGDYMSATFCNGGWCDTITGTDTGSYDCTNYNAKLCYTRTNDLSTAVTISCNCSGSSCSCNYTKDDCSADEYCANGQCVELPP